MVRRASVCFDIFQEDEPKSCDLQHSRRYRNVFQRFSHALCFFIIEEDFGQRLTGVERRERDARMQNITVNEDKTILRKYTEISCS